MSKRFEITFENSREDVLDFNEVFIKQDPAWAEIQRKHRRSMRIQALVVAPFIIGGASYFIAQGNSTPGMYFEGALIGTAFAAFLIFALPRVNAIEKLQKQQMEQIRHMDLSEYTGPRTVIMNEEGIVLRSKSIESTVSWRVLAPGMMGSYFVLLDGTKPVSYLPSRCFDSKAALEDLLEHANGWHQAAQLPHAQRLERYLSDRDYPCPKCTYNLRGMNAEVCPECGESIQLDALLGSKLEATPRTSSAQ